MKYVDYIVVGGGISGSVLTYTLMKYGASVHVFDVPQANKSSIVASGLWNPIVLKRMKKVWNADAMIESLQAVYPAMENWTNQKFYEPLPIRRVFHNAGEQNQWVEHSDHPSFSPYLNEAISDIPEYIIAAHGSGLMQQTGRVHVSKMLDAVRGKLKQGAHFSEEEFDWDRLEAHGDGVKYGALGAHAIISCEGAQSALGESKLKVTGFSAVKGEVIKVELAHDLGKECIHQGHFMIGEGGNRALVGATYAWDGLEEGPSTLKRQELEDHVQKVWDGSFRTIGHKAGIRPAVKDRRPLIGPHPKEKNVWVFNGMGSRAVLMTPYLAQHLVEHFMYGSPLLEECLPARMMK